MTTDERFGRNLSAWLQEDGAHRVPDHLAEVLVKTTATRQRPWWSSPERWLPMDTTLSTRQLPMRGVGRLVLVALLILAFVLTIIAVGARRQALPEPFGLARNGALVTTHDGDIFTVDPRTSEQAVLIGGAPYDFGAVYSRDGTKLVFLRSEGRPSSVPGVPVTLTMWVANADGSDLRALTPLTLNLDWFDWSPDGTRIAYVADKQLWVVDVASGARHRVVGTGPIHFPTWLPPDGSEIVFRGETMSPAIWAIPADGSGKRRVLSKQPASNEADFGTIAVAPDGRRIAFTRWSENVPDVADNGWLPRVFVLDIETGAEIQLPTERGTGQVGGAYSPDGKLVAYARIYRTGGFQLVVANADGSGHERTIGDKWPSKPDGSDVRATWAFTPDGTGLVVRYGNDDNGNTYLMPLDGSTPVDLGSGGFEFTDVQRLAR
jgi:Tol biopolymer transport system component